MSDLRDMFVRHLAQTSPSPIGLEIARAEGSWLYTTDGRRYLDMIAGIGVAGPGSRAPAVRCGRAGPAAVGSSGWRRCVRRADNPALEEAGGPRRGGDTHHEGHQGHGGRTSFSVTLSRCRPLSS